jgi:hypothetical protein
MTHTFTVTWKHGKPLPEQQDAVWYHGDGYLGTASLTTEHGETYSLEISCDGETRFNIPRLNEDGTFDRYEYETVRYHSDWYEQGIHTDREIQELSDLWLERGVEIHINNSWFDLYTEIDGLSEHLDAVTHEIKDAVSVAEAVLIEVAHHGSWEAYFKS